jgi:hypothetical protein
MLTVRLPEAVTHLLSLVDQVLKLTRRDVQGDPAGFAFLDGSAIEPGSVSA